MENSKAPSKVLLLSCSTGEGHNACAKAIAAYFAECGAVAEVADGLMFVSRSFSRFLSKGHSLMYRRGPVLFQFGWGYSERHPQLFDRKSPIFKKLASGVELLYRAVTDGGYDTVISTHALTAVMLTEMLLRHPMNIKTAFVATDYTSYPCLHMTDLQYYLIPHESLVPVYAAFGIPRERMVIGGIPLRRAFFTPMDKFAAKVTLGLDPRKRHLLVMGGSMGCGPMARIVKQVVGNRTDDVELTVVCGNNRRLFRRLSKRYRGVSGVHIAGYCETIPLYMAASDLYLTKPGGISVSEAATAGLPMVLVNAVAGCETYNLNHFLSIGGAVTVTAKNSRDSAGLCLTLLSDREALVRMEAALCAFPPSDGAALLMDVLSDPVPEDLMAVFG